MYGQANNLGPRLISAQNYQNASQLAQMKPDSSKEGCEFAPGWNVVDTAKRNEEVVKEAVAATHKPR